MIFSQDRLQIRRFFVEAWNKHRAQSPLEPLEKIIVDIIGEHPEYHALLENAALEGDYPPELGRSNPFLHMGMHIALREQLAGNRPPGILAIQQLLLAKFQDPHEVEHRMAECLGEALWQAQRNQTEPDESAYLECLQKLLGSA